MKRIALFAAVLSLALLAPVLSAQIPPVQDGTADLESTLASVSGSEGCAVERSALGGPVAASSCIQGCELVWQFCRANCSTLACSTQCDAELRQCVDACP